MSEKSFRLWSRARGWAAEILGTFSLCLAQTEAEGERFAALGGTLVKCLGNLKFAAAPLPYDDTALHVLRAATTGRNVWLMASTHRGEEALAAPVHRELKQNMPRLLTIIVPRHAVRGDEIAAELETFGLNIARRSKAEAITPATDIYLADTMGELGIFYRLAPMTALGGSFVPLGGHNPVEPAQLGSALILGPSMFNFSEIADEFVQSHAATQLSGTDELGPAVKRLLTDATERDTLAHNAQRLAEEKRHVLEAIMMELQPLLPQTSGIQGILP